MAVGEWADGGRWFMEGDLDNLEEGIDNTKSHFQMAIVTVIL